MIVLPWVLTSLVVLGCAGCLVYFGRCLDRANEKIAQLEGWSDDITDWIEEQFGGPEPIPVAEDTARMEPVELAGGLRTGGRHRAPGRVTPGLRVEG